ncbi:MAG: Gfo/Idh/MocA family oxidoreductase [Clostridia bacterium]|nr:Gfo/Idh/MocA family oxidoreductase [Clostridia bacterium]
MLKVGLVGCGGISGAHIPAWVKMEGAEVVAICDLRQEMIDKYDKYNIPGKYLDFDEMLEKEELDILDICLPTYLHADYSIKAMEKGINVICEKPISLKREDVERVYACAEKNNVKFMVAQVLRFWPEFEKLKEFYDNGRFGRLLSGRMQRLGNIPGWSWDGWMRDEKRSGLVPFDLHIHDLDFIVYAFGTPKKHTCLRTKRPDQDYMTVSYEYDDFFITTEASWYAACHPFKASFRFQFEKAVVVFDGDMVVYDTEGNVMKLTGEEGESGVINLPKSNAYKNEIIYFADCVKNNLPVEKVKAEELATVLDIIGTI